MQAHSRTHARDTCPLMPAWAGAGPFSRAPCPSKPVPWAMLCPLTPTSPAAESTPASPSGCCEELGGPCSLCPGLPCPLPLKALSWSAARAHEGALQLSPDQCGKQICHPLSPGSCQWSPVEPLEPVCEGCPAVRHRGTPGLCHCLQPLCSLEVGPSSMVTLMDGGRNPDSATLLGSHPLHTRVSHCHRAPTRWRNRSSKGQGHT